MWSCVVKTRDCGGGYPGEREESVVGRDIRFSYGTIQMYMLCLKQTEALTL